MVQDDVSVEDIGSELHHHMIGVLPLPLHPLLPLLLGLAVVRPLQLPGLEVVPVAVVD